MHACRLRFVSCAFSDNMAWYCYKKHCTRKLNYHRQILNSHNCLVKLDRFFSVSKLCKYEIIPRLKVLDGVDLKKDAVDMFNTAIRAVSPKSMIENMLKYDEAKSQLKVEDKVYHLNRNVSVVGFGMAVMGMARVVEDMLSPHVVNGIISIPKGMQKEMTELQLETMLLSKNTKIQVFEGAHNHEADEATQDAAKAIHDLVMKLTNKDVLIVLCSGGGSTLCSLPEPPITLQELCYVTKLLKDNGASMAELNIVRKNIDVLKGGGLVLALEEKPVQVLSLVLSSIVGNSADLVASGPTYPTQPTPHHCIEILKRLHIFDQTPQNIRRFLEKWCKNLETEKANSVHYPMNVKALNDASWSHVQNIVVGNNSIACEAAAARAAELGYLPLILTTTLTGEARNVGCMCARLAKFITMCFDRKASFEPNTDLAILETTLVREGIRKTWINWICKKVDMASNSDRDICIIVGGNTKVIVHGSGTGGKNMESALAAAVQMQDEFSVKQMKVPERQMCFLSGDTDGYDGVTKMAGAVVDQDFLQKVSSSGLDMKQYLDNNDSFSLFNQVNGGQNLIPTNLTGTNVMDIVILLVQRTRM